MDTGFESLKTASKKVVHKTGKFLGSNVADTVKKYVADTLKDSNNKILKQEPVEEVIIPPEKTEILNKLRQVL